MEFNKQFRRDLEAAQEAELIVLNTLAALDKEHTYELVRDNPAYYYKGDIKAVDASGKEIYIEVKDDSRIADTGNILCEEEVYYKKYDYYGKGNMQSDYDIYTIVSKEQRKIYIIDFRVLKKSYRLGQYKEIQHPAQTTFCYLLEIARLKQLGGLICILDY